MHNAIFLHATVVVDEIHLVYLFLILRLQFLLLGDKPSFQFLLLGGEPSL